MIHSGSRGLGHQVATDALTAMERAMARDGIHVNDRQLACAHISSQVRAVNAQWLYVLVGAHPDPSGGGLCVSRIALQCPQSMDWYKSHGGVRCSCEPLHQPCSQDIS